MLTSIKIEVEKIRITPSPFLSQTETAILVALLNTVRPQIMIEIGCQQGRTAKIILDSISCLKTYIGIDVPFGSRTTLSCQRSEVPYTAGMWVANEKRFALIMRERGSLDLTAEDLEPCDAVFIDGDHSANAVLHDSCLARALVRPGGIIIWHDYGNPAVEVTQVLEMLNVEQCWPIQHVENTWLAYRRI